MAFVRRDFIKGLAALTGWGALAPAAAFVRTVAARGSAAPVLECHVAGTSHSSVHAFEADLSPGDRLRLQREPDNPHDSLAVLIFDERGNKLGYIPRAKNEVLARLMDAGKLLFARIEAKEWLGEWLKISARVYLRDI